jgi:predicted RNA binding protein YcfA (HicA-like mRNA interferase family)
MKARELIKKLSQDGWQQIRQKGSHRIFQHPTKPGLVVVPDHAGIDLKSGTLNDILKKAGLK